MREACGGVTRYVTRYGANGTSEGVGDGARGRAGAVFASVGVWRWAP